MDQRRIKKRKKLKNVGYGFLKLCAEMEENEEPFLSLKLIWFLTIKSIVCHLWKWDISREHGCYLSCPPPTYTQVCRCPPLHILSSAAVPPYIYSVLQLSSPTVHILSSAAVLPYTHFLFLAIPSVQKFRLTSKSSVSGKHFPRVRKFFFV